MQPNDTQSLKPSGTGSRHHPSAFLFLVEIKRCSSTLSEGDKPLALAMIRKMATMIPPPARKPIVRRASL